MDVEGRRHEKEIEAVGTIEYQAVSGVVRGNTGQKKTKRELEAPIVGCAGNLLAWDDLRVRDMGRDLGLRKSQAAIFVEGARI